MISECVTKYSGYKLDSLSIRSGGKTCTCWVQTMPGFDILQGFDKILFEELEALGVRTYNTSQCHTSRETLVSVLINTNVSKGILEICTDSPITRRRTAGYIIPLSKTPYDLDLYKYKRMRLSA